MTENNNIKTNVNINNNKKIENSYNKNNTYNKSNNYNKNDTFNKRKFNNKKKPYFNNSNNDYNNMIQVMALGGLGEVGKNCYLIEYKKSIYIIDYGVLFPNREQIGIDYIIPNYTYLKKNEHRIKGLFVTHGHEDHIGGIPFLLKKVKIPRIYAPLTAKLMIERKLKEHKINFKIDEISGNQTLNFNDVKIHTYHQTHSIPDSVGFFFETPVGNVATTGDFKIDFSPPGEEIADFHKIVDLSRKETLCLLSDSTNSMREGFSESAHDIGENLKTLMNEATGLILYTTFASHINRIQKIVEGALQNKRKICVLGRSMKNNLAIGMRTGYIKLTKKDIIEPKELKNYNRNEVCILSTGSQGEELAALSRIAHGLNQNIELTSEDTVVFASSPIPGNNYQIGKLIDVLLKTEAKIITNSDVFKTHTSGHASIEEQKLILSLFKPKYFLPVHGTYGMLLAHKKTAIKIGIPEDKINLLDNGDAIYLSKYKEPIIKRNVTPGHSVFIAGNNIDLSLQDSKIKQLAGDGILIISAVIGKNNELMCYPQITTRGFIIINESIDLLKLLQQNFIRLFKSNQKLPQEKLKNVLDENLKKLVYTQTKKNPVIRINFIEFNINDYNELKQKK